MQTFDPFANAGKDSAIVNVSPYKPERTYQTSAISFKIPASQPSASNGTPSSTPTLTPSFWATAKTNNVEEEKPMIEDEDTSATGSSATVKKEPAMSAFLQQVFGAADVTPVKSRNYDESQSFFSSKKKAKVDDDDDILIEKSGSGKKSANGSAKKTPAVPIVIDIDDDETTIGSSATTADITPNSTATPKQKKSEDDDNDLDLIETEGASLSGRNFKKSDSFHGLQNIPDIDDNSQSIRDLITSEVENKSPVPTIDALMQRYDNLDDSFEQEEPSTPVKKQAKPVDTASLTASPPFIKRQSGKDIWDNQATPVTGKKKNSPSTTSVTPKSRGRRTNKSEAAVSPEAAAADDTLTPFMSKRRKENREDECADLALTPRRKSRSPKSDSAAPSKLNFNDNDDF